ncbi:hypothetical protein LUZ60_016551 [Juncus effusus]|nr:hypothetical protein LUZ60_016551 [Juncus effusus]
MASLFQKFQQAVKTLSKNRIFTKDPRNLQFEADINRLFLYTSYNRLGEKAEEKDAEEIIQLASRASVTAQVDQVHENIHAQFKTICGAMDQVLVVPPDQSGSVTGPPKRTHKTGLSFAVGKAAKSSDIPIPPTHPLTPHELSESLKSQIGYTLQIKPSQIPDSGQGLFLSGQASIGSLIAFYPGVVYSPAFYNYIPNYPRIDLDNPYLISRYDGTVIDAKPWGTGGANREFWNGSDRIEIRADNSSNNSNNNNVSGSDRMWKVVSNPLKSNNMMKSRDLIERRNPLAFAHFANHPSKGISPNVMLCPYDFPLSEKNTRVYLPNVVFGGDEVASMRRFGTVWFKSWGARKEGGKLGFIRGLVLVATRVLENEEVFLNYRLSNVKRRPEWYVPVDLDEDKRRWS